MIEQIIHRDKLLAVIIRSTFAAEGVCFCTPNDFSQQLAYMHHPEGKTIQAHVHNPVAREVLLTQEVLFIKKGKLRVDIYDESKQYLESKVLQAGDIILLAAGGHGFEVLENAKFFEVKQGPFIGTELDKERFDWYHI